MADFFEETENVEENEDIIILHNNELDKDEEFYHLATLDVDNKWYVVLQPAEELEDIQEGEVLIYEVVDGPNAEDTFKPIEDEKVLQKVFDEFMKELEKEDEQ